MSKVNFANSSWKSSELFLKNRKLLNGFGKFPYILKVAKYLKSSEISLKVSESVVRSVKVSKSSKKFRNILTGYKRLIIVKFRKVPKSSENLQLQKYDFYPKIRKFRKFRISKCILFLPNTMVKLKNIPKSILF